MAVLVPTTLLVSQHAETFTERTSEVLTQQGHEVTIFTASS